jgi:HK97 family phage major capsid protein
MTETLEKPTRVVSEAPVYHRHGQHSYFQDLTLAKLQHNGDAEARLQRHAGEWQPPADREFRIERRGEEMEVRVTPNWTPGTGGYFAPPAWLIERYADLPRAERVLARLAPNIPLPRGPQSINVPILTASVSVNSTALNSPVPDTDMLDTASQNQVVTLSGQEDVPLAMLEQSPAGAAFDWVTFKALRAAYDEELEYQLLAGTGTGQILGLFNVKGVNQIAYTTGSPTASTLFPVLAQAMAAIGNNRKIPLEAWLFNSSRFAWLSTSEIPASLPLMLSDYKGDFPTASVISRPVYLDDAMPAFENTKQVPIIGCCPSDLLVLESEPTVDVMLQPLSGTNQARIQMHTYAAAVTNLYPTGISIVNGTGLVPAEHF